MWLGNTNNKKFMFYPTSKKTRRNRPRTKFWKPLAYTPRTSLSLHNLSTYTLSKNETQLLNLGLKYIPPSPPPSPQNILKEYTNLSRSLCLRHLFRNSDTTPPNPFKLPNPSWNPPSKYLPLETLIEKYNSILQEQLLNTKIKYVKPPYHLLLALNSLKRNTKILILPADKNIGVCVLDRDLYYTKAITHLSDTTTYKLVTHFPLEELLDRLNTIVRNNLGTLSILEANYILHKPPQGYRVANIYFLPKIHKTPFGFRPICSYNNSIFEQTSKWLHYQLLPILLTQKQYLKDSHSLIQTLENLNPPPNSFIFTFDVESLYPSIPPKLGLEALRNIISPHFSINKTNLIYNLSALTLEYHFLTFDNQIYQQIKGTAMGSNFSVVYTCLFLSHLENSHPSPHLFYFTRYIDDAFGVWTGTKPQLLDFLKFYGDTTNNSIRLTIQTSPTRLPFLDIWINLLNNKFSFNCFQKSLNTYQYLPFSSNHPLHVKHSFISNELKRYLIRESTPLGYSNMRNLFFRRLTKRGYPPDFILRNFRKYPYSLRQTLLFKHKTKASLTPTIFRLRYTHNTPKLGIQTFLTNLYSDFMKDPQLCSIPKPLVCWTKSKTLHSLLVQTKFTRSPPTPPPLLIP